MAPQGGGAFSFGDGKEERIPTAHEPSRQRAPSSRFPRRAGWRGGFPLRLGRGRTYWKR